MKYEAIAVDLDGTLLTSKRKISPATRDALIDVQKAGRTVILASGRPEESMIPLAEELEMDRYDGFILAYNGGKIIRFRTGEILYNKAFPRELVRPLYELVRSCPGVNMIVYQDNQVISGIRVNKYTEIVSLENSMPIVPTEDFPNALHYPINKLFLQGDPALMEPLEKRLQKEYAGLVNAYRSDPWFIEVMPPGIEKPAGLKRILDALGLAREQLLCCGDGFNDVGMMKFAGLAVAMGNAQDVVKEQADFITKSNDEDGIAFAVKKFM